MKRVILLKKDMEERRKVIVELLLRKIPIQNGIFKTIVVMNRINGKKYICILLP